jgi:hypothetical protein
MELLSWLTSLLHVVCAFESTPLSLAYIPASLRGGVPRCHASCMCCAPFLSLFNRFSCSSDGDALQKTDSLLPVRKKLQRTLLLFTLPLISCLFMHRTVQVKERCSYQASATPIFICKLCPHASTAVFLPWCRTPSCHLDAPVSAARQSSSVC